MLPQGPLGPPAPRGSRVEPRGARAEPKRAPRAAQAVPGGEALSTKMGDARAEHAPEGLVNPAVAWGTLGAHVVNARGAHGACGGRGVSVRSLTKQYSACATTLCFNVRTASIGLCKRAYEPPPLLRPLEMPPPSLSVFNDALARVVIPRSQNDAGTGARGCRWGADDDCPGGSPTRPSSSAARAGRRAELSNKSA